MGKVAPVTRDKMREGMCDGGDDDDAWVGRYQLSSNCRGLSPHLGRN